MTEEIIMPARDGMNFEDFKNQNGITYWWATDFMLMLGYKELKSFIKVIDRATRAFVSLNISHYDNIVHCIRDIGGKESQDFKLTRFACYLIAMNGDPKKAEVAEAQSYFAQQTRKLEIAFQNSEEFERLVIRDELTEGNKSLASAASQHGVTDYARFQNAGFLGMYNMNNWDLKKKRNIDSKTTLADHMGRTELAANLFRVTQTEERIKSKNITGQNALEKTHFNVGREVREIVQKNVGKSPEALPKERKIADVKKQVKDGYKKMSKEDNGKKKK